MFRNLVLSAAGAGLVASLVVGALQLVTTEPLILAAEVFEDAGGSESAATAETESPEATVAGAATDTTGEPATPPPPAGRPKVDRHPIGGWHFHKKPGKKQ